MFSKMIFFLDYDCSRNCFLLSWRLVSILLGLLCSSIRQNSIYFLFRLIASNLVGFDTICFQLFFGCLHLFSFVAESPIVFIEVIVLCTDRLCVGCRRI